MELKPDRNIYLNTITTAPLNDSNQCKLFSSTGTILDTFDTNAGHTFTFATPYLMLKDTNYVVACGKPNNLTIHYYFAAKTMPVTGTTLSYLSGRFINYNGTGLSYSSPFFARAYAIVNITVTESEFIPPTTSFSSFQNPATIDQNITLICTDANAGCNKIAYRIDSGSWATTTYNPYEIDAHAGSESADTGSKWFGVIFRTKRAMNLTGLTRMTNNNSQTCKLYDYAENLLATATTNGNDNNFTTPYALTADTNYVLACGLDNNGSHNEYYSTITLPVSNTSLNWLGGVNIDQNGNWVNQSYAQLYAIKSITIDTNLNVVTKNFAYSGLGTHTIDYNSTDTMGNVETMKSSSFTTTDYNIPINLTVKYPKNEETLNQIDGNWFVNVTGCVSNYQPTLNTDKNITVYTGIVCNFTIGDANQNNYFDRKYAVTYTADLNNSILQPYLVSTSTGILTTINTKDTYTSSPVPNITIKIYKTIPTLGRTLIQELVTDSKGQALSLLVLGDAYEFETYDTNGTLLKVYNVTASSATIVIYLNLQTPIINPPQTGFTTTFTPIITGQQKYSIGTKVFTQTVHNLGLVSAVYTSRIIDSNGSVLSNQTATSSASTYTFTHTINWQYINLGTLVSRVIITYNDTNTTQSQSYNINNGFDTNVDLIQQIKVGIRPDFMCSSTPNPLTGLLPLCFPLLGIAIFASIILVIWLSAMTGSFSGQATGIVFAIPMVLFTYLEWVPVELTVGAVLILFAFVVYERRT